MLKIKKMMQLMLNSKYACQYAQMIDYLCYYLNTRWVPKTRPVSGRYGYGYKILPARLRGYWYAFGYCRGQVFALPAPYPTRWHPYL